MLDCRRAARMGALASGWRVRNVVGEALANTTSALARSTLLTLAIVSMIGALFWAELMISRDVKAELRRFDAAGGRVAVVDGANGVDASACDQLRWRSGIVAAGGYRVAGQVVASTSPRVTFALWEVTGDVTRVWDPNRARSIGPGYLVGAAAARELGLRDGSLLQLHGQEPVPVGTVDPSPRNEAAARVVMSPAAPRGRVAQCWVEFEPGRYEAGLAWLAAYFAADDSEVRRAVDRGMFGVDPDVILNTRPQRWGWVPIGIVTGALITLAAIFRRPEAALYQAFGVTRTGVLVMHHVEATAIVGASLAIGTTWAAVAYSLASGVPDIDQLALASRSVLLAAALALVVGPVGATLAGRGAPADLLKER